jgi:hypothetical protein
MTEASGTYSGGGDRLDRKDKGEIPPPKQEGK